MTPEAIGVIATALATILGAVLAYFGVRGSNKAKAREVAQAAETERLRTEQLARTEHERQQQAAQVEQQRIDLDRLRAIIDEMGEEVARTRARAERAEKRTDDCEAREAESRREMAAMRRTVEDLIVRDERRAMQPGVAGPTGATGRQGESGPAGRQGEPGHA